MKKITAALCIVYTFAAHHNASAMLIVKSLSKCSRTKIILPRQNYYEKEWTNYSANDLTYETKCLLPLFRAHTSHDALLNQIIENQKDILERLRILESQQNKILARV